MNQERLTPGARRDVVSRRASPPGPGRACGPIRKSDGLRSCPLRPSWHARWRWRWGRRPVRVPVRVRTPFLGHSRRGVAVHDSADSLGHVGMRSLTIGARRSDVGIPRMSHMLPMPRSAEIEPIGRLCRSGSSHNVATVSAPGRDPGQDGPGRSHGRRRRRPKKSVGACWSSAEPVVQADRAVSGAARSCRSRSAQPVGAVLSRTPPSATGAGVSRLPEASPGEADGGPWPAPRIVVVWVTCARPQPVSNNPSATAHPIGLPNTGGDVTPRAGHMPAMEAGANPYARRSPCRDSPAWPPARSRTPCRSRSS